MKALCERHVTRAGFYAWAARHPSRHARGDEPLVDAHPQKFAASDGTPMAARGFTQLAQAGFGWVASGCTIDARSQPQSARSARLYRRMPGTRRFFTAIPNRVLNLQTTASDQILGRGCHLPAQRARGAGATWRGDGSPLAAHSAGRWAPGMISLTLAALNRLLLRRRPTTGLVFTRPRGGVLGLRLFRARPRHSASPSMKRPREIGDNAFIESFFIPHEGRRYPRPPLRP